MTNYYFLASLLPEITVGHVPSLGFQELKALLDLNLTPSDQRKLIQIQRFVDIQNFKALTYHQPIDPRGSLDKESLETALEHWRWNEAEEFSLELQQIFLKYAAYEQKETLFTALLSHFFKESIENFDGFIREYFTMEYHLRLVLTGFRAAASGVDLIKQLQFEDSSDPFVAQILAQKGNLSFEPPFEYRDLKPLYQEFASTPLRLNLALLEYRFDKIREMTFTDPFGTDRILGFVARLMIVEKYNDLDFEKGIKVIDQIERNVQ